jgi:16S rRNA processing protein RimM
MSAENYAVVGRIRRAHGIRGELVVEPLTDEPDAFFASGRRVFAGTRLGEPATRSGRPSPEPDALEIRSVRDFKGGVLITIDAVSDRTEAERWNERTLLLPLDELGEPAEGEVFLHDLPGMKVVLEDGSSLGAVARHYELPQGIVLEVIAEDESGREVLLPFSDDVILSIDSDARTIQVRVPDGLLD